MTSTYVAGGFSLVVLILLHIVISVEAFDLHPLGLRSVKSQLNVNKAKEELKGVLKLEGRRRQLHDEYDEYSLKKISSNTTPHGTTCTTDIRKKSSGTTGNNEQSSRNQFLLNCSSFLTYGLAASTVASWSIFPDVSNAKSYSENAANFERINNGDFSAGAVFNNNPTTERGKKRRAMTGCKVTMSREEASTTILKQEKMLSEQDCNIMVMDGETEFMLQALRNLDCPTCANGIGEVN